VLQNTGRNSAANFEIRAASTDVIPYKQEKVAEDRDTSAAINESFKIYPNPAYKNVTTKFTLGKSERLSFHVCDITGKKIISTKSEFFAAGPHTFTVNVNSIQKGTYVFSVRGELNNKSELIIKL
jgi:type IX secretion system substrate protein